MKPTPKYLTPRKKLIRYGTAPKPTKRELLSLAKKRVTPLIERKRG